MKREDHAAKVAALMHDPPAKFDATWYRGDRSGHRGFAARLREVLESGADGGLGSPWEEGAAVRADWWMASADRPQLGTGKQVRVGWRPEGLVTHPLDEAHLTLKLGELRPRQVLEQVAAATRQGLDGFVRGGSQDELAEQAYWWLWRRWRGWLSEHPPAEGDRAAWERLIALGPADTRCPDHSLWDHLRMASALSWGPEPTRGESSDGGTPAAAGEPSTAEGSPHRETWPWLMEFSVGPVGAWLREARTTRDLWVASMLMSEVSLAGMQPVIEAGGPDAVLYPDLAHNARFDRDVAARPRGSELLAEHERSARTRAALIPNRWLAVVRAETEEELRDLMRRCRLEATDRWRGIGREVRDQVLSRPLSWMEEVEDVGSGELKLRRRPLSAAEKAELREAWTLHIERDGELHVELAARRWEPADEQGAEVAPVGPPSLPAQTGRTEGFKSWREESRARWERLGSVIGVQDRLRYDRVRHTWAVTARAARRSARVMPGLDYAPTVHALKAATNARKLARSIPMVPLHGDACTACGTRPALGVDPRLGIRAQRERARALWRALAGDLGWDDPGQERLCGVCTTRRFLVSPWGGEAGPTVGPEIIRFHRVWSGEQDIGEDGVLRLPMPSTAAIAAAPYLAWLHDRPGLEDQRRKVLRAAERVGWPKTFFPRSLHAVRGSLRDPNDQLSWLEPTIFFKGPREAALAAMKAGHSASGRDELERALDELMEEARRSDEHPPPLSARLPGQDHAADGVLPRSDEHPPPLSARFAVITVDGDNLGQLMLGAASKVGARWEEVLHPEAVRQIRAGDEPWQRAWKELLREERLIGPSLHAFINRVVTTFANRIVPWVVEREHHGRLVYAGGDDVLALAPAQDALLIAARLQELWSAAWVIDTRPSASAWSDEGGWEPETDRRRFRVVKGGELPATGEVLPMLGRYQSLSAGVAYAHFKTPLHQVVQAAREAQHDAKEHTRRRGACAEVLFTRSGAKYRSVLRWGAVEAARAVRTAFVKGSLPGRLPYKLRQTPIPTGGLGWSRLARGVIARSLEEGGHEFVDELVTVWAQQWPDDGRPQAGPMSEAWTNLLLARALASDEEEG